MNESEAAAVGVFPAAWVRVVEHRQALVHQPGLPPLAEAQLRRELAAVLLGEVDQDGLDNQWLADLPVGVQQVMADAAAFHQQRATQLERSP